MPLPKTQDVGKIMSKLKEEGGKSRKQMVAIALSQAKKSGANIPDKPKMTKEMLAMHRRATKK